MTNFIVRKVAVLGAGVMGAQIAAHCVNARVPVVLFDLPSKTGDKNGIAKKAVEQLKKQSPAPLGHASNAALIAVANYDDDLETLRSCDLVIEAIAERLDWKHDLYARVAPFIAPQAIFASNTSGLSITSLAEGMPAASKRRFCGVHFFNPPRYMHLVELIGTADTQPDILDRLETFLTTTLGKGVVRAKDTPNFIANRVGIFSMLATMFEADKYGQAFDVVDDLTGAKMDRAKSGTFRTADVVRLDTMGHVVKTMQDQLKDDTFAAVYATPPALAGLIEKGALGQKTGAGFYKKVGRDILRLDTKTGEYVASGAKADETVVRILKKPPAERLKLLRESKSPQAQFLWAILRDSFHYLAVPLAEIADNAREIDFAMRWGFGQKQGPFELWQSAGWKDVAAWVKDDIDNGRALSAAPLPDWVFEGPVAERGGVHQPEGSYSPKANAFVPRSTLPVYERQIYRASLIADAPAATGKTIEEDDSARIWILDRVGLDDVVILSFKTKGGVIGPGVIAALGKAIALAESEFKGLVLWSPGQLRDEPFSYGADLQAMLPVFMAGGVAAIGPEEKKLQDAMLAIRYAQVPTVAAVAGMALGGGCEIAMYCAKRVASLETYMGLVEVGVGLLPGGGGLTYGARRAAEEHAAAPDSYLLDYVKKYFTNAATAAASKSALEARQMGYLLESDPVVFNPHELLASAIREAQAMHAANYRPPMKTTFPVVGRSGIATITGQLINMRDGGFISAHDFHIGRTIAEIMCGGDVEGGSLVDEDWVMAMERKGFMGLLAHPKSQERVMGMMQTGKPVRN
ncbi:MAG: 3-hydroxyacyl-CoA dehydrogenase/enoyl-CoA hydratase family protein [Burkholderiaceae bacterium]